MCAVQNDSIPCEGWDLYVRISPPLTPLPPPLPFLMCLLGRWVLFSSVPSSVSIIVRASLHLKTSIAAFLFSPHNITWHSGAQKIAPVTTGKSLPSRSSVGPWRSMALWLPLGLWGQSARPGTLEACQPQCFLQCDPHPSSRLCHWWLLGHYVPSRSERACGPAFLMFGVIDFPLVLCFRSHSSLPATRILSFFLVLTHLFFCKTIFKYISMSLKYYMYFKTKIRSKHYLGKTCGHHFYPCLFLCHSYCISTIFFSSCLWN